MKDRCPPEKNSVVRDDLSRAPWQHVDLFDGTCALDLAVAGIRKRFGVRALRYGETGDPTGPCSGLKVAFNRVSPLEEVDLFSAGSHG